MTDLERVIKDRLNKECTYPTCHEIRDAIRAGWVFTSGAPCYYCHLHDSLAHLLAEDVEGVVKP